MGCHLAGRYILVGNKEGDDELPTLYIGEGDAVRDRVESHDRKKDFWAHGYAFVTSNSGLNMLDEFSQASGASGGPPSLGLLIPQATRGRPEIDGAVLPVISRANWTRLTRPWIENAHRAGARPAV